MSDFRKITPVRRTSVPAYSKYTQYKKLLRIDFHYRCGYCGDHDFFRMNFYEVDHFVPKKYLKKISETDYSNLVYSCRSCNNFKRAKWPTKDESIHNNGKEGFIDPCNISYANQFTRMKDGSICPITKLGEWMWSALNMANPVHRLTWSLEQLRILLKEIDKNVNDYSQEDLRNIQLLNALYRSLEEQLKGTPNFE